jgi:hypothetical protein
VQAEAPGYMTSTRAMSHPDIPRYSASQLGKQMRNSPVIPCSVSSRFRSRNQIIGSWQLLDEIEHFLSPGISALSSSSCRSSARRQSRSTVEKAVGDTERKNKPVRA